MRQVATLIVLSALTAACGDGDAPAPPAAEVTDSAGVSIVTSAPSEVVYAELASEPSLSLGEMDGPEEVLFGQIASVARDDAGNLWVADAGASEVRLFAPDGTHLRTVGRSGEGPGEFQGLTGAWPLPGGDLVAADRRMERVTRFSAEGDLLGSASLTGGEPMAIVSPIGPIGPGAFLTQIRSMTLPAAGGAIPDQVEGAFGDDGGPPERFMRLGLDSDLLDTLAQLPGMRMSASTSERGAAVVVELLRVPFSAGPSATGSVHHGAAITGGAEYSASVYDAAGALVRIVRLSEAPTPRTDEHLEAYVRNMRGRGPEPDEAQIRATIARYQELPMPETLPAYTEVRLADTGELWARRFRLAGAPVRWDVFGADGAFLGRVEAPESFRVEEASRDEVVGVSRDEFDVERVEVRPLILMDR